MWQPKLGMSSGSVFTYVESKEALFHLVFGTGSGNSSTRMPPLPLATPAPGETVKVIEQGFRTPRAPLLGRPP